MENSLNELTEAPLGVATSAPLPKQNCIYCCHFTCGFEVPFCLLLECELGNLNNTCDEFDFCIPKDEEIERAKCFQEHYEKVYNAYCVNKNPIQPTDDLPF